MRVKLIALFSALILLITACSAPDADLSTSTSANSGLQNDAVNENNQAKSAPLLWKISDDDNSVYMMGTIHVGNETTNEYEQYVTDAYNTCSVIAVECDTAAYANDRERVAKVSQQLLLNDGTKTKDHIDSDIYDDVVTLMKSNNIYNENYENYIPFVWVNQFTTLFTKQSGLSSDYGVDSYYIEKAKSDGKKVFEIESVEKQYDVFKNISDEYINLAFREAIRPDYFAENTNAMKSLYNAWRDGDEEALDKINGEEYEIAHTSDGIAIIDEYKELMIYDRNETMAHAAEAFLEENEDVLILVGMLHFVGEQNIISLLENQGLTPVQLKP